MRNLLKFFTYFIGIMLSFWLLSYFFNSKTGKKLKKFIKRKQLPERFKFKEVKDSRYKLEESKVKQVAKWLEFFNVGLWLLSLIISFWIVNYLNETIIESTKTRIVFRYSYILIILIFIWSFVITLIGVLLFKLLLLFIYPRLLYYYDLVSLHRHLKYIGKKTPSSLTDLSVRYNIKRWGKFKFFRNIKIALVLFIFILATTVLILSNSYYFFTPNYFLNKNFGTNKKYTWSDITLLKIYFVESEGEDYENHITPHFDLVLTDDNGKSKTINLFDFSFLSFTNNQVKKHLRKLEIVLMWAAMSRVPITIDFNKPQAFFKLRDTIRKEYKRFLRNARMIKSQNLNY